MTTGAPRHHWDWFIVVVGLVVLALCGLNMSVVAFSIGMALLVVGLAAALLGPHLAGADDRKSRGDDERTRDCELDDGVRPGIHQP